MSDVLELPKVDATDEVTRFSDVTNPDKLELAYTHTGLTSEDVLIEGFRRGLFTGTELDRKRLRQKMKACVCKSSAQAKII